MSEDLLRKISDTLDIQHLKAVYCTAADMVVRDAAKATEIFRTIFVADAKADYGVYACEGREALIGYLVKVISENNIWLWHSLTTPRIEIDGDRATGDWAIMVQIKQKQQAGKEVLVGRYSDDFVRTPEGWRLSSVRFVEEGIYPQIDVTSEPHA